MTDFLLGFDRASPGLTLAFVAGMVNSLSPCCLALTPAFMAHLAGVQVEASERRTRLWHVACYTLGFSAVFVILGLGLSLAGFALGDYRGLLWKIGGVVVITFGLTQAGLVRLPLLSRSFQVNASSSRAPSYSRSLFIGATYSIAWTPCIGPVLGAILTSSLVFGDAWVGAALLGAFALGMAIPHLAAALAFERFEFIRRLLNRRAVAVERVSGAVMVVMGVLIFTGTLPALFKYFQASNVVI